MYKAKPFLYKDSLLSLYFSYIHSYINYGNLAWASTHKTNFKKIHSQQKHALKIVYNKDRYYHTKELFGSCNILNVYKLNLLNTSIFMHKIKNGTVPAAFHTTFKMPSHSYLTRLLSVNCSKPKLGYAKAGFRYLYEVQLYTTILSLIQRNNLNLAPFLNQKSKLNFLTLKMN